MTGLIFMNIHTALRGILDAFINCWTRQPATEVEQARTRIPSDR